MQVERPSADLLRKVPVCLYLFDLLYLDQHDARQLRLRYRKVVLRKATEFRDSLRFTEHRETEGEPITEKRAGDDGKASSQKMATVCTSPGERAIGSNSSAAKNRSSLSAVTRIRAGSGRLRSVARGFYHRGKLVYAGNVGTGYDTGTLQRLGRKLAQLQTPTSPFAGDGLPRRGVHWVKPKFVAQIGFTEWTPGGKLRHPRFLGLREDRRPEEVMREG